MGMGTWVLSHLLFCHYQNIIFLVFKLVRREHGEGRSLCKLVLEITHFASAHISLARSHSYGHYQMQWKTLIRAAICSVENLEEL